MSEAPSRSKDVTAHWLMVAPAVALYSALAPSLQHTLALVFALLAVKLLDGLEARIGKRWPIRLARPLPVFATSFIFAAVFLPLGEVGLVWGLTGCALYAAAISVIGDEVRNFRLIVAILALLIGFSVLSFSSDGVIWPNPAIAKEAILFLGALELARPRRDSLQRDPLFFDFCLSAALAFVASFAIDSWLVALSGAALPTLGLAIQNQRRSLTSLGSRLVEDSPELYGGGRSPRMRQPAGALACLVACSSLLAVALYFALAVLPDWTDRAKRGQPLFRYVAFQAEALSEQSQLNRPDFPASLENSELPRLLRKTYQRFWELLQPELASQPPSADPSDAPEGAGHDQAIGYGHSEASWRPADSTRFDTSSSSAPSSGSQSVDPRLGNRLPTQPPGITIGESSRRPLSQNTEPGPPAPAARFGSAVHPPAEPKPGSPKTPGASGDLSHEPPRSGQSPTFSLAADKQSGPTVKTSAAAEPDSPMSPASEQASRQEARPGAIVADRAPITPSQAAGTPPEQASVASPSNATPLPSGLDFGDFSPPPGATGIADERFSLDHTVYRQGSDNLLMKASIAGRGKTPALLYLRTGILDTFDRSGFKQDRRDAATLPLPLINGHAAAPSAFKPARQSRHTVAVTTIAPLVGPLPIPDSFRSISVEDADSVSYHPSDGLVYLTQPAQRARYELSGVDFSATARAATPDGLDALRATLIELPLSAAEIGYLDAFAKTLAGNDRSPDGLAKAAYRYFAQYHPYSHDFQLPDGEGHPSVRWLKARSAGICAHYTSAFTALARSQGIPTRIVTGYLTYERDRKDSSFLVRSSNAHAWIEYLDHTNRWIRFDPTPPLPDQPSDRRGPLGDLRAIAAELDRLNQIAFEEVSIDPARPDSIQARQATEVAENASHGDELSSEADLRPSMFEAPTSGDQPNVEERPLPERVLSPPDHHETEASAAPPTTDQPSEVASVSVLAAAEPAPATPSADAEATSEPYATLPERSGTNGQLSSDESESQAAVAMGPIQPTPQSVPLDPAAGIAPPLQEDAPNQEANGSAARRLLIFLGLMLTLALGLPRVATSVSKRARSQPEQRYRHIAGRLLNKVEQLIRERHLQQEPQWEGLREELIRQRYGRRVEPDRVERLAAQFREQRSGL